ncbi:hypothetical protein ZYGR_0H03990 [Zygosaccharomyces rouxii]|uniref:GATA-type domain-containing protein n=1 Tax=Zygosaccharomyces rouxii TaxID=4956 RepID=A0A1Q2ZW84_ZYGRO|nr:hypothetical protein ZYGR_0H03990 [Zygosaccharomyces rouxii]
MSTAVNSYSISSPPPASVPPMPTSTASAGSDDRRRSTFDDLLLLPSFPSQFSNTQSYSCYSTRQLPPTLPTAGRPLGEEWQRKYSTAPASPHHHSYAVTPKNSPSVSKAQLATPVTVNRHGQDALPSLRHLQLLPDPRIQEYAYMYPDTSEFTPWWKRNLMHWCKSTNYHSYTKIVHEVSHDRTQLSALLRGTHSSTPQQNQQHQNEHQQYQFQQQQQQQHQYQHQQHVPSVLEPKDTFKELSNSASAPMTPPMSPGHDENLGSSNLPVEFTPFVSDKLVQTVKKELHTPSHRHRKTNSFRALQLKRLLDNRDVLSVNSRPSCDKFKVTKPTVNVANVTPATTTTAAAGFIPSQLPTPSRSNRSIGSAARQLALKMDARSSPSPTRIVDNLDSNYQSTPLNRSRSRSISPVRPATPPHGTQTSKYHRFSLESPQSPVVTSVKKSTFQGISAKTSPTRRPSTSSHGLRKCVSCHSSDSPCWRPSWSGRKQDQLCNSCGLRYKKTHTRCLNESCRKIPTKGELSIMKTNGVFKEQREAEEVAKGYRCLFCNGITQTEGLLETTTMRNA